MQHDRRDEYPARDEPGDQLRRERASGARHLRAAGLVRVHVLVRGERPRTPHVAVADRRSRARRGTRRVAAEAPSAPARGAHPHAARGSSRTRRPAGRVARRPPERRRAGRPSAARRSRTDPDLAPLAGVERWSPSTEPSARLARKAAGSVADVLTTSRSPGSTNSGSWRKPLWTTSPPSRETSRRTSSRARPRASAGASASSRAARTRSAGVLTPRPPRDRARDRCRSARRPRSA